MDYKLAADGNLATESFSSILEQMRKHYTSDCDSSFQLPVMLSFKAGGEDLPEEFKKENNSLKEQLNQFNGSEKESLQKTSETKVNNKISDEEWKRILKEQRNDTIQKATDTINQYYDKVQAIGDKHPESRGVIVVVTKAVSDFVIGAFKAVGQFISDLVTKIYEWLKEAYNQIASFFENSFNLAASFFQAYT